MSGNVVNLLLVSTLCGAAVGIERQWSGHADGARARFGGLRTFTLLGLLGGFAGVWSHLGAIALSTTLLAGATALVVVAYAVASRRDVDATTEVAALVVLASGVMAGRGDVRLAAGVVALTVLLLVEKSRLHAVVRLLDDQGFRAGVRFAVLALVVLPLLPEGPVRTARRRSSARPVAAGPVLFRPQLRRIRRARDRRRPLRLRRHRIAGRAGVVDERDADVRAPEPQPLGRQPPAGRRGRRGLLRPLRASCSRGRRAGRPRAADAAAVAGRTARSRRAGVVGPGASHRPRRANAARPWQSARAGRGAPDRGGVSARAVRPRRGHAILRQRRAARPGAPAGADRRRCLDGVDDGAGRRRARSGACRDGDWRRHPLEHHREDGDCRHRRPGPLPPLDGRRRWRRWPRQVCCPWPHPAAPALCCRRVSRRRRRAPDDPTRSRAPGCEASSAG